MFLTHRFAIFQIRASSFGWRRISLCVRWRFQIRRRPPLAKVIDGTGYSRGRSPAPYGGKFPTRQTRLPFDVTSVAERPWFTCPSYKNNCEIAVREDKKVENTLACPADYRANGKKAGKSRCMMAKEQHRIARIENFKDIHLSLDAASAVGRDTRCVPVLL